MKKLQAFGLEFFSVIFALRRVLLALPVIFALRVILPAGSEGEYNITFCHGPPTRAASCIFLAPLLQ